MLLRPSVNDLKLVAHDLGRVMGVVGVAGLLPLAWAVARAEWRPASHLLLMVGSGLLMAGVTGFLRFDRRRRADWSHGMVVVALAWLIVPALGTIPLFLSGRYRSWSDSYFDAMSGVTTTGLSLIQDLDHLADSVNVWRHTLHFLGGQGIVLAALLLFSASGALSMYQAEGREDRIFPSVGSTARFIWLVSVTHLVVGVGVLTFDGIVVQGFDPGRSLFHGLTVFMAAFDTGGFTPLSTNIAYYHSAIFEATVTVLMLAGAMSFGLHHAIWLRRRGILRNLEVRTLAFTVCATTSMTIVGLALAGTYGDVWSLVRRGGFHVISAHTGTGFTSVPPSVVSGWPGLALGAMVVATALGGMTSSTAGGVKSLRIGLTVKAILDTVRAALLPEQAVISTRYHQYGPQQLDPRLAQSVMAVSLLYVALFLGGAAVSVAFGYGLQESLFESVNAAGAAGMSLGITSPDMPELLQLVMTFQMWIGRLEFVAVFALFGFVWSMVRGR